MLFFSNWKMMNLALLCLIGVLPFVYCEDEMSLQVSVIEPPNEIEPEQIDNDICHDTKCPLGERCILDNEQKPVCDCVDHCETPKDERQKVSMNYIKTMRNNICSTANKTYDSDCHFFRSKCWCSRDDMKCRDRSILGEKLDYYGECRYIEQCTDEQKTVFPNRMKIWLDEVLHILNKRKDLDPRYLNLVKLADEMKEHKVEKYWTAGVIFEFCALDKSKDHKIQKDELGLLVSSIKALESCIAPFLDECDTDNNDSISDDEWGRCLDLSPTDLRLLREKC